MKVVCVWFLTIWIIRSLGAISSIPLTVSSSKTARLGPPMDPGTLTSTTTVAPTIATTSSAEIGSKTIGNTTALNNTKVYDHTHKILLIVLSDLNVREIRDPQKQGKTPTHSNTTGTKNINEALILDEQWLKDFLKKLHPANNKDDNTKCADTDKSLNIVPNFVPPTSPWVIRKEPRKPIVYIQSIVCDGDTAKNGGGLSATSALKGNKFGRRQPRKPFKTLVDHAVSKALKSTRKHQRPRTAHYVLMPKLGATEDTQHSAYPLNYFRNNDFEHIARGSDTWSGYSFEDEE